MDAVAAAHGKSAAQVLIRWSIQLGNVVIPRAADPARLAENIDVFDFELTDAEMATPQRPGRRHRFRPNPDTYAGDWKPVLTARGDGGSGSCGRRRGCAG